MSYRVPVLERFAWQEPVLSFLSSPPTTPAPVKGDRYIVGDSATDVWVGQETKIVWFDGISWVFDTPTDGWKAFDKDTKKTYVFVDGAWQPDSGGMPDLDGSDSIDWILKDNDPNALIFRIGDPNGPIIFNIDTTDNAEKVTINSDLVISGDLTIQGKMTTIESQDLVVKDQIFTLNKGGNETTARGSGFEISALDTNTNIESIIGYIKSTLGSEPAGYDFLPPGSDYKFSIQLDPALTKDVILILKESCIIDQDLSTLADVTFNSLTLTQVLKDVGGNEISVSEIREAYDSRAIYDDDLQCIVFDDLTHRSISMPPNVQVYNTNSNTVTLKGDKNIESGNGSLSISEV